MKGPNKAGSLDYVDFTVEGNEDLSVRPWKGPSPFKLNPVEGAPASVAPENLHTFIVNDEDISVRPWRQATATPTGSGSKRGRGPKRRRS